MFLRRHLSEPSVRAGLFSRAIRACGPRSNQHLNALPYASRASEQRPPATLRSLSGYLVDTMGKAHIHETVGTSFLGRFNVNSSSIKVNGNISLPCAMSVNRFIHSGKTKGSEAGLNFTNTNFGREILDRTGNKFMDSFPLSRHNVEQNADIVHIKMLRNNAFVTVTDSKGNKKFGVSAGKLTDKGGKVSRYAAEASAEQVGRDIRGRGIKSVVVKVNGFTFFKKKKQAILGIREGYSHSRGDKNPIVYIEDTTRRPHNGCRLRKKRRV